MFGRTVPRGSVGPLGPGIEGRVVRPDGTDADYDEPGELWVRGPNMSPGYFRNEESTKKVFGDGWVRTGDTLKVDRDGMLMYVSPIVQSTLPVDRDIVLWIGRRIQ